MIQIYLVKLGGREDTFFSVFLFFCLFLFSFVFALFCVVKIVVVFLCIVFVVKIFKNEIMSYTVTKKGLILLIFMIVCFRFCPNLSSENIYFLVNQCDSCFYVFNFDTLHKYCLNQLLVILKGCRSSRRSYKNESTTARLKSKFLSGLETFMVKFQEEELILYCSNFMQLLNSLFKVS